MRPHRARRYGRPTPALVLLAGLALGGCAAASAESVREVPAAAPAPEPSPVPRPAVHKAPRLTLWAAAGRISRVSEYRNNGFAGLVVHGATIEVWWKGRLTHAAWRAVAYVRSHSDITVEIHRAKHSRAELRRLSEPLIRSERWKAVGVEPLGTLSREDGSGFDLLIHPLRGISAAEKARRIALAKRVGREIVGVPILSVRGMETAAA